MIKRSFTLVEFCLVLAVVVILICLGVIVATGVTNSPTTTNTNTLRVPNFDGISTVEYNGHTYVVYRDAAPDYMGLAMVHDPDCKCHFQH